MSKRESNDMSLKAERPLLLLSTPITDRIKKVNEKIDEQVEWNGEDAPAVKAARWVVAELEDALDEAEQSYEPTKRAHEITGWDEQTLLKWARRKLHGEKLPFAWRNIQVRKEPGGYGFKISSLPLKPKVAS